LLRDDAVGGGLVQTVGKLEEFRAPEVFLLHVAEGVEHLNSDGADIFSLPSLRFRFVHDGTVAT